MRLSPVPLFSSLLGLGLLAAPLPSWAQGGTAVTGAPPPVPAVPPPSNANAPTAAAPRNGLSTFTPAPVPGNLPEQVAPADRISGAEPGGQAHDAGPANATPLSSAPSSLAPSDNVVGPHSREGVPSNGLTTPNLSR